MHKCSKCGNVESSVVVVPIDQSMDGLGVPFRIVSATGPDDEKIVLSRVFRTTMLASLVGSPARPMPGVIEFHAHFQEILTNLQKVSPDSVLDVLVVPSLVEMAVTDLSVPVTMVVVVVANKKSNYLTAINSVTTDWSVEPDGSVNVQVP